MSMSITRQRVAICLLMGALGMAQVMGLRAGYICDCSEQEQPVASASCDVEDCHPGIGHGMQPPVEGADQDEKEYPHSEQRENLEAIGTSSSTQIIKPALAMEMASLFATWNTELHAPNLHHFARPERSRSHHPPDQLRMIRSIVLLS